MNRDIKFRGKDRESWHYGNLVQEIRHNNNKLFDGIFTYIKNLEYKNGDYIGKSFPVNSDTIGQYTGLHDKNGKEIYEGDIVYCQTKYGKAKALIEFIDGKFVAYWNSAITHPQNGHHIACYDINKKFEVIGNVFENPELLGGEDEC